VGSLFLSHSSPATVFYNLKDMVHRA
jgi:hypothetical protein